MRLSRWGYRIPGLGSQGFREMLSRAFLAVIVITILAHRIFVGRNDPQRCVALLSDGSWPPHDTLASWRPYFHQWEPRGCRMYEYQPADIHDCLAGRSLVFVGDSTVRQVFYATAKRLDKVIADEMLLDVLVSPNPQHDIELEINGVRLVFIWDPWLNSTGLASELQKFSPGLPSSISEGITTTGESAAMLLVGAPGLWAARNGGDEYFELFRRGIDTVRPWLKRGIYSDSFVSGYNDLQNRIVVAPVQVPRYWKLSPARAESLTKAKISHMNTYLNLLPGQEASHVVTAYNQMTRPGTPFAFEDTGIHVREALADRKADILLNLRCNGGLVRQSKDHRNQETCCSAYEPLHRGHYLGIILLVMVWAAIWIRCNFISETLIANHHAKRRHDRTLTQRIQAPLALVGVILYCYSADRTQLFPKAIKRLSAEGLIISLFAACAVSVASLRRWYPGPISSHNSDNTRPGLVSPPKNRQRKLLRPQHQDDPGFLSREMTEEWKGWMQGLLLIFSYQELSDQLWATKSLRLLPAAYLFIVTYGHATYFIRTNDFSFRRVFSVVWRLNTLPFLLSMAMDTSGSLYWFPRLATFWFAITYITFRLGRSFNPNPKALILKICLSAVATISLIRINSVFALAGWFISHSAPGVTFDADAVRRQLDLNRFVPFLGMTVAVLAHRVAVIKAAYALMHEERAHQLSPLPGASMNITASKVLHYGSTAIRAAAGRNTIDRMISTLLFPQDLASWVIWPLLLVVSWFSGFGLFFVLTQAIPDLFPDIETYDGWHPYLSCSPILAYVLLRNAHPSLRISSLPVFAALGRISLETYVLCHHLLLAGDGKGLLRLGLARRAGLGRSQRITSFAGASWVAETMILGVVFVWCSWHTRRAVVELGRWVVDGPGAVTLHSESDSSGCNVDLEFGSDELYRLNRGSLLRESDHTKDRGHSDRNHLKSGIHDAIPSARNIKVRVGFVLLVTWLSLLLY